MKDLKSWDRLLWAVEMKSKSCKPEGILIGEAWHKVTPWFYKGQPSRALLFTTRIKAQQWCKDAFIKNQKHSKDWSFKVVRVRETISPHSTTKRESR